MLYHYPASSIPASRQQPCRQSRLLLRRGSGCKRLVVNRRFDPVIFESAVGIQPGGPEDGLRITNHPIAGGSFVATRSLKKRLLVRGGGGGDTRLFGSFIIDSPHHHHHRYIIAALSTPSLTSARLHTTCLPSCRCKDKTRLTSMAFISS